MKKIRLFFLPLAVAFFTVLILELLSQRSLSGALRFLTETPLFFLLNLLIVSLTLIPGLIVRRRIFYYALLSGLWTVAGIVNFVLQSMRTTPFEFADLSLIKTGLSIADQYLTTWMIVLIVAGLILFFFLLGILFQKSRRYARHLLLGLVSLLVTGAALASLLLFLHKTERIDSKFGNIVDSYHTYGFVYCYAVGIFDRGIDKPEDFSKEQLLAYAEQAGLSASETEPETKPNIIFVQLESFFNVHRLKDLAYSEDPIPNFSALLREYSSGLLHVPSLGAGTVNTEFEMLTGMSLDYFGPSDYPYKLLFRDNNDPEPCESAAYLLREIGYTAHALHNNTATFYSRDFCYAYLGFDTFTSIEYMQNVDYNALGWAEDTVLTAPILSALDSTESSDYVFAVSVNGHGGYPSKVIDPSQDIFVTEGLEDPEALAAYEYYINRLSATDDFIGELLSALSDREEKTVVVFYGDHLPGGLGIDRSDLSEGDLYDTEYVIWSNYDLGEKENEDLEAYQLSAKVLGMLGISRGYVLRLHQNMRNNPLYESMLEFFEYDLLEGRKYLAGEKNPHEVTELRLGAIPIIADAYLTDTDGLYVTGVGFTEWSVLTVDGQMLNTELLPDGSLFVRGYEPKEGDRLSVGQYTEDEILLSSTPAVIWESGSQRIGNP